MKREIINVRLIDSEHVECKVVGKYYKDIIIKRKVRSHTSEIRELKAQGIYCFEIQGWLYWYQSVDNSNMLTQYKEPEDFRSEDRTTDKFVKSYASKANKNNTDSIKLDIPKVDKKPEVAQSKEDNTEVKHEKYDIIKTCIEQDIPVYLCGEAGTGKNYTLEQISWELGLEFYFTNSVQQEYKLTGFIDAGGTYHETEFYKAFTKGGIFFLDEIDASIPEVLVLLNAAIANRYFEFPNGKVTAHKNFRVVSAGNTVGSGATLEYTGRLVLDQATLDRFVIIEFDYDRNIELHLAKGNEELVDFVRSLRKSSKENGIRATFSYRCIKTVTRLERTAMDLTTIMLIAVVKGLDKDTINCLSANSVSENNKYRVCLSSLQVA